METVGLFRTLHWCVVEDFSSICRPFYSRGIRADQVSVTWAKLIWICWSLDPCLLSQKLAMLATHILHRDRFGKNFPKSQPSNTYFSQEIHYHTCLYAELLVLICALYDQQDWKSQKRHHGLEGVAVVSAKNQKRQRCKRQSVTAKREKSQTPKVLTAILTLPNLT